MNNARKLLLHAALIKNGLHSDTTSLRRLLLCATAATPNDLSYSRSLFAQLPYRDTFAYNTLIRAHSHSSPSIALQIFTSMRRCGVPPDHFTFPFVLKACAQLHAGRETHSLLTKLGFDSDVYVQNALISFYGHVGAAGLAFKVFDEMPVRDLVSWSSVIAAFSNNGFGYAALALFQEMQLLGDVEPDDVMMLSVVSAVSSLGAVELGWWVESFIFRSGMKLSVSLGTALIDMYSRCGSIEQSVRVFDEMPVKNVLTWTVLITGLAVHGRGKEALIVFNHMKEHGLNPDSATFSGVLVACSHNGLIEDGWQIFNSIKNEYGMEPLLEHYGCMVDLLGRAGSLKEAFEFVQKMPMRANAVIWRTLLGACVSHKNLELAEKARQKLLEFDQHHDGDYVLLSNAYGGMNRWLEKTKIRDIMREKGISKRPGYSLLDVDGVIFEFLSGQNTHGKSKEAIELLESVVGDIRNEGYSPNLSSALHDIEEEEKEQSVSYHSEKLAVAYALVSYSNRRIIRVIKNLRICHDCHCFMKHVSRKFGVEIIVRDRNRFHHFNHGTCTCKDFW